MPAAQMTQSMLAGGVDLDVAELLVRVIYSFTAGENQTYRSIVGALCILDRLEPLEVAR